jgi:hypothetical protein
MKLMNTRTYTIRFTVIVVATVLLLSTGINAGEAQDREPTLGKLTLEGQSITRIILLHKETGQPEEFRRPEQSIELPVGQYRVQEVHLEGGYVNSRLISAEHYLIRIGTDEPATLKIGGPLKPTVKMERQGRQLVMTYALVGVSGEQYTGGDTTTPPTFTVYRGDKIIASDTFEYG